MFDYNVLDDTTKKLVKENFKDLMREIFGSDIDLIFKDGNADLKVIGGDINLTGTAVGNTVDDLYKLVRNRVLTRILTTYGETTILPPQYGSYLDNVIGLTPVNTDELVPSNDIITVSDMSNFISSVIKYSLEDESLVIDVTNIDINYDDPGVINISINFISPFLNSINVILDLVGD